MKYNKLNIQKLLHSLVLSLGLCTAQALIAGESPKLGEKAPDFTLKTLDDQSVRLSDLTSKSQVALIVLRGWPGYQCPFCDRQVQDFIQSASAFADAKVQLIFVYPGPASELKAHAEEFKGMKGREWPKEFLYVMDPDFDFVNTYGLRWNAPNETSYPSTFIIDTKGVVRFVKISHEHGDRTKASEVLAKAKMLAEK